MNLPTLRSKLAPGFFVTEWRPGERVITHQPDPEGEPRAAERAGLRAGFLVGSIAGMSAAVAIVFVILLVGGSGAAEEAAPNYLAGGIVFVFVGALVGFVVSTVVTFRGKQSVRLDWETKEIGIVNPYTGVTTISLASIEDVIVQDDEVLLVAGEDGLVLMGLRDTRVAERAAGELREALSA